MTGAADIELLSLPAPDYLWHQGHGWPDIPAWSENTVRQIVAHAIAPLQAEIEALQAEVEDYRENGASAVRFAPSSAHWSNELRRLFGDDAREGIEVLEQRHRDSLARADKLEAAAPELLAALVELRDWYTEHTGLPAVSANAAIAKATGEAA